MFKYIFLKPQVSCLLPFPDFYPPFADYFVVCASAGYLCDPLNSLTSSTISENRIFYVHRSVKLISRGGAVVYCVWTLQPKLCIRFSTSHAIPFINQNWSVKKKLSWIPKRNSALYNLEKSCVYCKNRFGIMCFQESFFFCKLNKL